MKYWLMADPHLGHEIMTEACVRPADFSELVLRNISQMVKPEDTFICLGDVCFGHEAEWHERLLGKTGAMPALTKRWLTLGNHDKRSVNWYLSHGWDFVAESFVLEIYGHRILFSHVPKIDTGYSMNIHGHFHNNDHRTHEPELVAIKNDRQFLLALESVHYQPVLLHTFIEKQARMS